MQMQRLPADGIVAVRMPGPLKFEHAASLHQRLEEVKREQGSSVSFVVVPGDIQIEALSDSDLARMGLQRIPAVAC
jgi:hypothetical protein